MPMREKLKAIRISRPTLRLAAAGAVLAVCLLSGGTVLAAADGPPVDAHAVPVVDGGIGPCSVAFIIKDGSGAPVYNAKIRVHIAYRFLSAHKLDLEVGTNIDGKARFDGLPNRVKRTLLFEASRGGREGEATYDPADGCKAERAVTLEKPRSDDKP